MKRCDVRKICHPFLIDDKEVLEQLRNCPYPPSGIVLSAQARASLCVNLLMIKRLWK